MARLVLHQTLSPFAAGRGRVGDFRLHKRGFTLIETMIAVAVLAILATIAIPNYLRYQMRSKMSEVYMVFGGIEAAQRSFKSSSDNYANVERQMPAGAPTRLARPWAFTPCPPSCTPTNTDDCDEFECIGFRPTGSTYFIYRSPHVRGNASNPPEFCIGARGDLDGDGDEVNFEMQTDGDGDGDGNTADCPWSDRNGCENNSLFPDEILRCDPEDW